MGRHSTNPPTIPQFRPQSPRNQGLIFSGPVMQYLDFSLASIYILENSYQLSASVTFFIPTFSLCNFFYQLLASATFHSKLSWSETGEDAITQICSSLSNLLKPNTYFCFFQCQEHLEHLKYLEIYPSLSNLLQPNTYFCFFPLLKYLEYLEKFLVEMFPRLF